MTRFNRDFAQLTSLEEHLSNSPKAMAGAMAAIQRAHRAAKLAAGFAIYRQDDDVEVLHQAALLNNFAGLLVWCHAPELALEMAARQHADSQLRSCDVQRSVLGVELEELEQALMVSWGLPPDLRHLTDPASVMEPGPHCVMLAVRIARHSQHDWHNAALPDDYAELGHLLNVPTHTAAALVRQIDH